MLSNVFRGISVTQFIVVGRIATPTRRNFLQLLEKTQPPEVQVKALAMIVFKKEGEKRKKKKKERRRRRKKG